MFRLYTRGTHAVLRATRGLIWKVIEIFAAFPVYMSARTSDRPRTFLRTRNFKTPYIIDDYTTKTCAHRPVWILWFHGNTSNIRRVPPMLANIARKYNARVAALEYPGYGAYNTVVNATWPWCTHEIAIRDAISFIDDLIIKEHGATIGDVILIGQSIGTGIAAQVAAHYGSDVGATILISPFTSIFAVAHPLIARVFSRLDLLRTIDVIDVIGSVCVIHGDNDTLIPLHHAEALATRANVRVDVVCGAGHSILYKMDKVQQHIDFFMKRILDHKK